MNETSAFGGKADINQGVAKSPLLAISGHSGDSKKPGVFPERATKDSSFPHKPLVEMVSRICYNHGA